MVVEVRMKDGSTDKYTQVVCAGLLGSYPGKLYIQTRRRGNCKEVFVDMDTVRAYTVREAAK